jgi:hypothetical protein
MAKEDFVELRLKKGGTRRILSILGLNKLRIALGMPPTAGPKPGEEHGQYGERLRSIRRETFDALKKAPPDLAKKLFGEPVEG